MECESKDFFDKRLKQYEIQEDDIFQSLEGNKPSGSQPSMYIRTTSWDIIEKPEGKVIFKVGASTVLQTGDDEKCIYSVSPKTGLVTSATYFNNTYSKVDIKLLRQFDDAMFSLTEREYIRTGLAFNDRLAYEGGLVLHGSAISYKGHGIIFSAPSGTGKSTHARLWKEYFGELVTIINDDKPAIRFNNPNCYDICGNIYNESSQKAENFPCNDINLEIPYIYGTPWSGKTDINTNISSPLKAIVFLKQSPTNRIERLGVEESMYMLASETTSPFYDKNLGIEILTSLEKLVKFIPIYLLYCNISYDAVKTVYNQIFERRDA